METVGIKGLLFLVRSIEPQYRRPSFFIGAPGPLKAHKISGQLNATATQIAPLFHVWKQGVLVGGQFGQHQGVSTT
jgi:hypothetical protein